MMPRPSGHPILCPDPIARAVLCALALWLAAAPSRAQECRVELAGTPSDAWRDAVRQLPEPAALAEDCARLHLEVGETGARLSFFTRDGRRADRTLTHPDELAPTLEALRVVPERSSPAVLAPERDLAALFSLSGGARGGDKGLLSPLLSMALALRVRRWEVGTRLDLEPRYYAVGPPTRLHEEPILTPNLTLARREPVGRLAVLGGVRLGMAVIYPERSEPTFVQVEGRTIRTGAPKRAHEGRFGTFVGIVVPRSARVRLRAELGLDLAWARPNTPSSPPSIGLPSNAFGGVAFATGPSTPAWALTALIGVELGGP